MKLKVGRLVGITLMVLGLIGVGGCVSRQTVDTPSGRPEISIQSVHLTKADLLKLIGEEFVNRGYSIHKLKDDRIVLRGQPHSNPLRYGYRHELIFTILEARGKHRVLARVFRLSDTLFMGTHRQNISRSPDVFEFQMVLQELRNRLQDEEAFEELAQ